jgi:hypothetical protein
MFRFVQHDIVRYEDVRDRGFARSPKALRAKFEQA